MGQTASTLIVLVMKNEDESLMARAMNQDRLVMHLPGEEDAVKVVVERRIVPSRCSSATTSVSSPSQHPTSCDTQPTDLPHAGDQP